MATAEGEIAELKRLLRKELAAHGGYAEGLGGRSLAGDGDGLARFVAGDTVFPQRGGFFIW